MKVVLHSPLKVWSASYTTSHSKKQQLSSSEQRKQYKAKLSYKREWGHLTAGSQDAWTNKGVTDWNHATELLRVHRESWCHRDAAITASMSQQAECRKSVLELQCSGCSSVYQCFTTQHPQPILWWSCRYSCILLCFQSSISPFRRSSFTRLWYKRSLAQLYGIATTVVHDGVTFSSPPLIDWNCWWMALVQASIDSRIKVGKGRKEDCQGAKPTRRQSLHGGIWSLLNINLALPVETASVERSFSHMKQIKTKLRNRLIWLI